MSYNGNFSFSGGYDNDVDADYIYYNATIINNRTDVVNNLASFATDPAIRFLETRDQPIVKDASKYNFSIIRFSMDGPNKDLPMFIPVIRTGLAANPQQNVNLTIYSVSLRVQVSYTQGGHTLSGTYTSTQPIIYSPETLDLNVAPVPLPDTVITGQDLSTRYYWVYTYSHWLSLVNNAFVAAIADLNTQIASAWTSQGWAQPVPVITTEAPQITYNPTTNLFSIYADRYGFGGADRTSVNSTTANESFKMFFNNNMFGMFANFQNVYYNYPGSELDNEIYIGRVGPYQNLVPVAAGTPTPTVAKTYWIMTQDYESTSTLWSPIESIVFNSTLLPLVFEQTGDPVRFGDSTVNTESVNSRPAFQPIITDISLPVDNAHGYRELIYYAPQAEYRLASFQRSRQAINQIDVQVYWKNRLDAKLYPVQMFNSSSVSLKIMFRRRGIYDYPHPAKDGVDV